MRYDNDYIYQSDRWIEEQYEAHQAAEYEKHCARMEDCYYAGHNDMVFYSTNIVPQCYCGKKIIKNMKVFK